MMIIIIIHIRFCGCDLDVRRRERLCSRPGQRQIGE